MNKLLRYFLYLILIIFLLFSIAIIFLVIQKDKIEEIILLDKTIIAREKTTINCDPMIKRKYRSTSIMIEIEENWNAFPPWKSVKLENGQEINIDVVLSSENGKKFYSNIIGSAGGMINVRFKPEIPINTPIKEVQILVDDKITIKKVIWQDWNPK